jgi:hypothetical protein
MACYNRFFLKHRGLAPIGGILFADSCEAQAVTAQPREKNQPPTWAGGAPGFLVIYNKSGWWYTYPSEKYEFVSWDGLSHILWKNKKYSKMFQTTKQLNIIKHP